MELKGRGDPEEDCVWGCKHGEGDAQVQGGDRFLEGKSKEGCRSRGNSRAKVGRQ